MSPVRTATRSVRGRASSVFSSNVVFPEPGELIKFTTRTSFCRKRSRNSAATRSFSLKTFFSSGTRFILLQLYVGELQFFPANALVAVGSTLRTVENEIFDFELGCAVQAAVTASAKLNIQCQPLEIRLGSQRFKTKAQRVRIDGGEFADTQPNLYRLGVSRCSLRLYGVKYGLCDSEFVHKSLQPSAITISQNQMQTKTFTTEDAESHRGTPQRSSVCLTNSWQLVAREHVHDAGCA